MARYTAESRERVRDAVDFAELVGARTELKRAGVRRLRYDGKVCHDSTGCADRTGA